MAQDILESLIGATYLGCAWTASASSEIGCNRLRSTSALAMASHMKSSISLPSFHHLFSFHYPSFSPISRGEIIACARIK